METKKTSLYQLHQDCNAKFVEFAGYQMPIQYKDGIIQEHKFTRSNSGIFDVSHMGQLFIFGDDNLTDDLENIFPIDLKKLNLNQSKYSFLMNKEGGIYDDLIITKIENGSPLFNSVEVNSVILEAQKKKIRNANDLDQVVKKVLNSNQKTILLVIYNSQNQRRYIGVKLD